MRGGTVCGIVRNAVRPMDIERRLTGAFPEIGETQPRIAIVKSLVCLGQAGSSRVAAIGRKEQFEVDDQAITLFGLCKDCRQ